MDLPLLGPLMVDLVEEVLLRVPPDDPASLVRAALVCKRWCRLISGASFRRRFREHEYCSKFVPASSFCPPHAFREKWCALDAHHGRVLAFDVDSFSPTGTEFIVWDPVTDGVQSLPILKFQPFSWSAAGGLRRRCRCRRCDREWCTSAYEYSSEQGAWSEPITVQHPSDYTIRLRRAHKWILKYELGRRELSLIDLPSEFHGWHIVLMEAEAGALGFATIHESKLSLWSREAGPDRNAGWAQRRTFELDKLLPVSDRNISVSHCGYATAHADYVVAVADTIGVIFMWTNAGLFTIHLNSSRVERIGDFISNFGVVPYMSFCIPALDMASASDMGPKVDASSASQT